jgi:hypothetical protein
MISVNANTVASNADADIARAGITVKFIPLEDLSLKGLQTKDDGNHPIKVGDRVKGESMEGKEIEGNITKIDRDEDSNVIEVSIMQNGHIEKIRLSSIYKIHENVGNKVTTTEYNFKRIKDFNTFSNETTDLT